MSIEAHRQLLEQQLRDIQNSQLLRGLSYQRRERMTGDLIELGGRLQILGALWSEFTPLTRWLAGRTVRRCLSRISLALDILETGRPLSLTERAPCR